MRLFTLFAITLMLILTGCSKPEKTMRVGSVLWPGYEPLFLARNLGYYEAQKIQLVDYLSNTDAMFAFTNGALEACAFTLDEALQIIASGTPVQIVLVMDVSHGGDVILANPQIDAMNALKGKRIGVESGAVGAYVLARALELHGLDIDDVEIVSILASEQPQAFAENQIDAVVTFDPIRTQLVNLGKRELFNSTEIPNEIIDVLVVQKAFADAHPGTVKALTTGWFKALEYNTRYPQKSAEYAARRHKITPKEFINAQSLMRFPNPEENRRLLSADSSPLLQTAQTLRQVLRKLNLTHEKIDLGRNLTPGFIE